MNDFQPSAALLRKKLTLKEGWCMAFPSNDEVQFVKALRGEPEFKLKEAQGKGWVKQCFSQLNGQSSVEQIISLAPEHRRAHLGKLLAYLQKRYLYDADQPTTNAPLWLQHRLAEQQTSLTSYLDIVSNRTITVVGDGILASALIASINELGFAAIYWITEGEKACDESVSNIIANNEQIEPVITQLTTDFIIYAQDYFDGKQLRTIERVSRTQQINWAYCQVDGWNITVGPCFLPNQSGCLKCWLTSEDMRPLVEIANSVDTTQLRSMQRKNLNPAFCQIAAGLLASDLPSLIGVEPHNLNGKASLALARYTCLDMAEFSIRTKHLLKTTHCDSCNSDTAILN